MDGVKGQWEWIFLGTFFAAPVYHSLLIMKEKTDIFQYNKETSVKVESLFKLIYDLEFIITLVIICNILDYLLPAPPKL